VELVEGTIWILPRKGFSGGRRISTRGGENGSAKASRVGLVLEGEIAVKVDFGLFHLPPALHAGFLVRTAGPHVAEDALAIELLFQTAEGLVDRLTAFEPDFNHEESLYPNHRRRERVFFKRV